MVSINARASIASCGRDRQRGPLYKTSAGAGCDAWEREPGIDDDDWNPPGTPRIGPCVAEPPPSLRSRSQGRDGWWTEPERPRRPSARESTSAPIRLAVSDPFGSMFNWQDD